MPCCTTSTRASAYLPLDEFWRRSRRSSRSTTVCCPRRRCSASSTATRSDAPQTLVLWEAQFGDFANGAQVIIDQFIASQRLEMAARQRRGAAVAARLRRPGTGAFQRPAGTFPAAVCRGQHAGVLSHDPAQHFHLLRRQMKRDFRKPLVVMTPKSLLRHKAAVRRWRSSSPVVSAKSWTMPAWIRPRCGVWFCAAARCSTICSNAAPRRWHHRHRARSRRAIVPVPGGVA